MLWKLGLRTKEEVLPVYVFALLSSFPPSLYAFVRERPREVVPKGLLWGIWSLLWGSLMRTR